MPSALLSKSVVQCFYAKLTSILRSSMCLAGDSMVSSCSGFEIGLWVLEAPSFMRSSGATNRICISKTKYKGRVRFVHWNNLHYQPTENVFLITDVFFKAHLWYISLMGVLVLNWMAGMWTSTKTAGHLLHQLPEGVFLLDSVAFRNGSVQCTLKDLIAKGCHKINKQQHTLSR